MGYHYAGMDEIEQMFPSLYNPKNPEEIRLFIVGEKEKNRMHGCEFTKKVLENMFEDAKNADEIKAYEVRIYDVSKKEGLIGIPDWQRVSDPDWQRIGNVNGSLFVPIFHNAGKATNLAHTLFDERKTGILSFNQTGYGNVCNYSKRACFPVVRV
ncbi:MAG: hypothetical protein WCK90_05930 [archaeon]